MATTLADFLAAQPICGHDAARLVMDASKIVLVVPFTKSGGGSSEHWLSLDKARAVSFLEKLPVDALVWLRSASASGPVFLRQEPEREADRG